MADAAGAALSLARLRLTNFRCYAQAGFDPDPRPVVLTGPNGAGKTNLLEAISFLAPGRGLRGARLGDLARRIPGGGRTESEGCWGVAARLDGPDGAIDLGTGIEAPPLGEESGGAERRRIRINGETVKSQAALADIVSLVWLTPQMDRLFIEGPSARRRFLDRLVYGFDPAHVGRVNAYEHALRERSRLLRRGAADPNWLDALEETMATKGVAVAAARRELASRLNRVSAADAGPFPGAAVEAEGTVEGWLADGPALAAEDRLRGGLAAARKGDAESGGAALGPHRSDFRVVHLAKGLPAEQCSTGEQKAVLVALILANARLQAAERGRLPLILLDEVLAHLDENRRQALIGELLALGVQAWLTGTDEAPFAPFDGAAQYFRIEEGRIEAQAQ